MSINNANLSMLCDYYEFTMANGMLRSGFRDTVATFDLFFRKIPDKGGFAICAGFAQVFEHLNNLRFDEGDIEFLRGKGIFDREFLDYLRDFEFKCDVYTVPEGTPVFPQEPILIVRGPAIQAQLIETMVLAEINHQSLIATKANRIVRAAQGRPVMEFGARRAHGPGSALYGARAAYIGGCSATSCTLADEIFGIPAAGTMAHSWVQLFDSEYAAFAAYARQYPDACTLLVDTYNTLSSGIPNAIRVFNDIVLPAGCRPAGIRIDSGDISYLSIKARALLDEAGFPDCKIVASNALDEYLIRDMLTQGAKVDIFGVGEQLITSRSEPVFGGVYKLSGVYGANGEIIPKIKISENVSKITIPHFKNLFRLYDKQNGGRAIADVITLHGEAIDDALPYEIFHPEFTWKKKTVTDFRARPLLRKVFDKGRVICGLPALKDIRDYCAGETGRLWDEVKRFENPHEYYVDLSPELWRVRQEMLAKEYR